MQFNLCDRASFEAFGDRQSRQTDGDPIDPPANFNDAEEVDVLRSAMIADELHLEETPLLSPPAPEPQVIEPSVARELKTGFSWASFAGGLAAFAWIGGAIGVPLSSYGLNAILAMDPAIQAGLIALAFGPATLFWIGASAAGEALKARRIAAHLARFAQDPHYPMAIGEAHAQRLSQTVKTEIESMNDAVATALNRLSELESAARRNAHLFDQTVAASRDTTAVIAQEFTREREALAELNADMRGQSENLAHSIGRQVRLMREASKLVKVEIDAAEDVLENNLAAFKISADVMAERTASFKETAESAHYASASLNNTMGAMLEGLGEATRLTDSARQHAAQATLAASETASALNEATQQAVAETKRAAQFIRQEAEAMRDAAGDTLSRLQAAADAARAASDESQAAADRHAHKIEQRLSALAQTAKATAAPQPAPKPAQRPLETVAAHAPRVSERTQQRAESAYTAAHTRTHAPQAKASDAHTFADFGAPKRDPDQALKAGAVDIIIAAGVDFDHVLGNADLERIAHQSRQGGEARRRAVYDASPTAVNRIARHLKRDMDAKRVALAFHARPDLAKNDRAGESDMVRAYLLLDAVLG